MQEYYLHKLIIEFMKLKPQLSRMIPDPGVRLTEFRLKGQDAFIFRNFDDLVAFPRVTQKPQPVSMHHILNVFIRVTSFL
jgi:hypothetical protein